MSKKVDGGIGYGIKTFTTADKFFQKDFQLIESLKIKHKFRKSYDLAAKLLELVNLYYGVKGVINSNTTYAEKISYFEGGISHVGELQAFISMERMGADIFKIFNKILDKRAVKKIKDSLKLLEHACIQCMVNIKYHERKSKKKNKIPKKADNEKSKSLKKTMLLFLFRIFREGSMLRPTVYTDSHSKNGYNGNFYNFSVAVSSILKRKFGINLGSNQTIGSYFKKIKKENKVSSKR